MKRSPITRIVTALAIVLAIGAGTLWFLNPSDPLAPLKTLAGQAATTTPAPDGYAFSYAVKFTALPIEIRDSVVAVDIDCFPGSVPLERNIGPGGWTFVLQTSRDSPDAPKGAVAGYLNIFEDNYPVVEPKPEEKVPSVRGPALTNVCIATKWRGRKLATPFINFALNTFAKANPGKEWIYLDVLASNNPAMAAYKAAGFEEMMRLNDGRVVMRRNLKMLTQGLPIERK